MISFIFESIVWIGYGFMLYIGIAIAQEMLKAGAPRVYNALASIKPMLIKPKVKPLSRYAQHRLKHNI